MSFGVEQLLQHRGELDAELRKHKSPITVMFTDLAGSTSYFDRHGDTAGLKWIEEHYRIIFPTIEQHHGSVVKTIGDSVMAYFTDPAEAVKASIACQQVLHKTNEGHDADAQMYMRVALHHGLAYLRGGDVFGDVVNVAARIAKACLPGQILISEAVHGATKEGSSFQDHSVGSVQFRGKSSADQVYEVIWTDEQTYTTLRERFPAKATHQDEGASKGRYMILSELGHGAMGVVYKAYDKLIGRLVAMKTIPLEVDESEAGELVERLKQEARTAGMLDHPNIVTIFDVGEEAGLFYFTMQYLEGKTLDRIRDSKELLPVEQVVKMMDQICAAVGFAHEGGIIHRDLKPSNMMITSQGVVKVMDFGIAKLGDAGLTRAGMILGTPSYLSPEQAGGRRIDHRSDIFALGAVLYELLTGEKAFPGESTTTIVYKVMNEDPIPPRIIEPSLPPPLDAVVQRALAKDPLRRFQSCDEFRAALKASLSKVPHVAAAKLPATVAMSAVSDDHTKRSKWPMTAAAGLVLLLIGGGAGWKMWQGSQQTVQTRPAPTSQEPEAKPQATPPVQPAVQRPSPAEPQSAAAAAPTDAKADGKQPEVKQANTPAPELETRRKERRLKAEESPPASDSDLGIFSRADVPDMLAKAGTYAGNGDYQRAQVLYQEILRLDPKNPAARDGLQKVMEARQLRR